MSDLWSYAAGAADSIREIEIDWPSGIRQTIRQQRADQIVTVTEPVNNH